MLALVLMLAGQLVGCGGGGETATTTTTTTVATTTTVTDTTTTTVATTTTTDTTATTTTSTTTTTWDGRYRVLVTAVASNESYPSQAILYLYTNTGDSVTAEVVALSSGQFQALLSTTEVGSYWVLAAAPAVGRSEYVGCHGTFAGEAMSSFNDLLPYLSILTISAETPPYQALTPFVLYPFRWLPMVIYTFDSDTDPVIHDSSGNDLNGTGTDLSFVAGKVNNAASFNGTTSKIDMNDLGNVDFGQTVAFWVKPVVAINDEVIYVADAIKIGLYSSGKIFYYHSGAGAAEQILTTESTLALNEWTYFVATLRTISDSGSTWVGEMNIYVNGTLEASTLIDNPTYPVANSYRFGAPADSDDPYSIVGGFFQGLLDEVRYYDSGISSIEVRQLYQQY